MSYQDVSHWYEGEPDCDHDKGICVNACRPEDPAAIERQDRELRDCEGELCGVKHDQRKTE